jgi:hypothetical protein
MTLDRTNDNGRARALLAAEGITGSDADTAWRSFLLAATPGSDAMRVAHILAAHASEDHTSTGPASS